MLIRRYGSAINLEDVFVINDSKCAAADLDLRLDMRFTYLHYNKENNNKAVEA